MNDYARGALEALAWVQLILDGVQLEAVDDLKRRVSAAKEELLTGAAVDFSERIRYFSRRRESV